MTLETSLGTYLDTLGDAYDHRLPKTGASFPALVYFMVSENYDPMLDNTGVEQVETLYQVTVWATTKTEARERARVIQNGLSGYVGNFNDTTVANMRVAIVNEGEDTDDGLKSVVLEIRIYQ